MDKTILNKKRYNLNDYLNADKMSNCSTDSGLTTKKLKISKDTNFLNNKQYSDKYYEILSKRKTLPIWDAKEDLIKLVDNNQVIILQGETGSGKTTQVPQFLLEDLYYKHLNTEKKICIGVTQPRRVAAMSVAKRVAEELDVMLGEEVGYSVRFDELHSNKTLVKYLTDGMLLREAISDPLLRKYTYIILDECHERTLSTDILFGLMKEILPKRPDLKLIVMSATMDTTKFREYFDNAPLLDVPGRLFSVEILYSQQPEEDYFETAINTAVNIHTTEKEGDILLFLTGEEEIETACLRIKEEIIELMRKNSKIGYVNVVPLYSTLPPAQQQKIFEPAPGKNSKGTPGRKIICATNIAETSLTIDGIVYVIDPGFAKQKIYNPRIRMESLLVSAISRASAKQRAGRAGRTRPGKCYRLYTEKSFLELQENTYPEILRSNLSSVVLTLKKLGIEDLVHFDFMDPPAPETMMRALEMLNFLGAMDDEGELTELGSIMAQIPLEPELTKTLLSSEKYNCMNEILSMVSMLSMPNCFIRPRENAEYATEAKNKFKHYGGDHYTLLIVYNTYKLNDSSAEWCRENFINHRTLKAADDVRNQLVKILNKLGVKTPQSNSFNVEFKPKRIENITKSLVSGFFGQVAHLEPQGYYITVKDHNPVFVHPSSVIEGKPSWLIYHEFVLTNKNYIRIVCRVDPQFLLEIASMYYDLDEMDNNNIKRDLLKIKALMDQSSSDESEDEVKIVSIKTKK